MTFQDLKIMGTDAGTYGHSDTQLHTHTHTHTHTQFILAYELVKLYANNFMVIIDKDYLIYRY